eukprot:7902736-Pyramimonas_sp.AAC.1
MPPARAEGEENDSDMDADDSRPYFDAAQASNPVQCGELDNMLADMRKYIVKTVHASQAKVANYWRTTCRRLHHRRPRPSRASRSVVMRKWSCISATWTRASATPRIIKQTC